MLEAVTGPYVEPSPEHCPVGHRLGPQGRGKVRIVGSDLR
jgi:hypothetical protein